MVNYFEVERLFLQYTGLPDGEKWCELIAGCCDEILLREKKEQSPIGQSILNQLAAANAWYRYLLVSEGTSEQDGNRIEKMQMLDVSVQYAKAESALGQARKLREELAVSAAPYLSDTGFVFRGM
jgi:hypothetical protein